MRFVRKLNKRNISKAITAYNSAIKNVGGDIPGLTGKPLFQSIKRDPLKNGPYQGLTLFECANRVMTDLVILHGVKYLLNSKEFKFNEYIVEYGNENQNDHDILASNRYGKLAGEAFNVAPSFFQSKKGMVRKKLNQSSDNFDTVFIF